jgi:hypothetical protein
VAAARRIVTGQHEPFRARRTVEPFGLRYAATRNLQGVEWIPIPWQSVEIVLCLRLEANSLGRDGFRIRWERERGGVSLGVR